MSAWIFYLGALVLLGLSGSLWKGTSPFSRCGCVAYEKKRIRRIAAIILIITAALSLTIGAITQNSFD